jgi:hypothetical protein
LTGEFNAPDHLAVECNIEHGYPPRGVYTMLPEQSTYL